MPGGIAAWSPTSEVAFLGENLESIGSGAGYQWSLATPDGSLYRQLTAYTYISPAPLPPQTDTSGIPPAQHSVVAGPVKIIRAHDHWVKLIAWSADGDLIATAVDNLTGGQLSVPKDGDNGPRVWDATSGEVVAELRLQGCPMGFVPPEQREKPVYYAKTDGVRQANEDLNGEVLTLDWSPQPGSQILGLATYDCLRRMDRAIVWDTTSNGPPQTFDNASALAFHPDGQQLALGYGDGSVVLTNYQTGAVVKSLAGAAEPIRRLAFSGDGARLAAVVGGDTQPGIQVWDLASGQPIGVQPDLGTCSDAVTDLALSQDGRTLAITRPGSCNEDLYPQGSSLSVFDLATGGQVYAAGSSVSGVAFSSDGRYLAATGGGIAVWDAQTWEVVNSYYGDGVDVAWNPDSLHFVTASSYGAYFWAIPLLVDHPATVHVIKDDQLNVRAGVGMEYDILARLDDGAVVTLLEGPVSAGEYTWWRVRTADGVEGWAVESADGVQTLVP
jgi:WD40 repeat protein